MIKIVQMMQMQKNSQEQNIQPKAGIEMQDLEE